MRVAVHHGLRNGFAIGGPNLLAKHSAPTPLMAGANLLRLL
jgi:hypothetical protein